MHRVRIVILSSSGHIFVSSQGIIWETLLKGDAAKKARNKQGHRWLYGQSKLVSTTDLHGRAPCHEVVLELSFAILQGNILSNIGNGEDTRVWNDPWIPNLPGKTLFNPHPIDCYHDLRVAALRTEISWDLSPVEDWLSESEISAILSSRFKSITKQDNGYGA